MKTIGVEIERRQIANAWVRIPDHWTHEQAKQTVATYIDAIRETADRHTQPLEWGKVYGPQYFLSAVHAFSAPVEFEPDYTFPDEAPPPHPDQLPLLESAR